MGQGQSNSHSARASAGADTEPRTSYYELLSVERSATDEDIKKAYRRKALELHPDRNYGDVERTTRLFAEIQAAYEVLSDPQERAWYDSHEDAILGNYEPGTDEESREAYDHSIGLTTADDINRLFRRFNSAVDFTDGPSGFFGFLRETFEQIAKEEEQAARKEGLEAPDYPSFGHKDDDYEDVVRSFYARWNGFSTRKSFAWRDRYHATRDMDRFMRRAMEKENKKFRDEAIREFNAAVRSLVAFVRKRDPRYTPNTQSEAERQQALRDAVAAQKARARAENEAKLGDVEAVPEWAKVRDPEELEEEEDEESDEDHFECVACRKTFKSERQFEAHERSKKHLKAVHALRKKLKKEGRDLDLENEAEGDDINEAEAEADTNADGASDQGETMEASRETVSDVGNIDESTNGIESLDSLKDDTSDGSYEDVSKDVETLNLNKSSSNDKTNPKPVENDISNDQDSDDDEGDNEDEEDEEDYDHKATSNTSQPNKYSNSSQSKKHTNNKDSTHDHTNNDEDRDEDRNNSEDKESDAKNEEHTAIPKLGKAAQKRAKKAAQQASSDSPSAQHVCSACKAAFPSRTQLFQHIQKFGHAAPLAKSGGGAGGGGSVAGKKKGKRK